MPDVAAAHLHGMKTRVDAQCLSPGPGVTSWMLCLQPPRAGAWRCRAQFACWLGVWYDWSVFHPAPASWNPPG